MKNTSSILVIELPIRDGNKMYFWNWRRWKMVIELPIRDGNKLDLLRRINVLDGY